MEAPLGTRVQERRVMTTHEGFHQAAPVRGRAWIAHFAWIFVGIALMLGAWSLATPMGAAPDEAAHTTQAAAIVRGQIDEPPQPYAHGVSIAWVRVPCWVDNPWLRSTCGHAATTGLAITQYSNAPPLYYLVIGAPSLVLSGPTALYAMRATGDILNAALIALGICLLLRFYPRRTPLIGVLLALTPMALFMMAVMNSSGFEIAAGFATWCGALCVATHPTVPRPLAGWTSVAVIFLVLSRPTSPLDALVIAVVIAVFVGWHELRPRLNRSLRPLWISLGGALVVAAVFLLVGGPPDLIGVPPHQPASLLTNTLTTLRLTGGYLEQSVGNFGLLDVPVSAWIVAIWVASLTALTAVAVVRSRSCRRALPVLAVAVVATTVALEAPQINAVGANFQGRYILPLLVGFPLVASALEWRNRQLFTQRILTRSILVLGIVLLVAQIAAFNQALQYYRSGRAFLEHVPAGWRPPSGVVTVEAMFVGGGVVTLAFLVAMARRRTGTGSGTKPAAVAADVSSAMVPT